MTHRLCPPRLYDAFQYWNSKAGRQNVAKSLSKDGFSHWPSHPKSQAQAQEFLAARMSVPFAMATDAQGYLHRDAWVAQSGQAPLFDTLVRGLQTPAVRKFAQLNYVAFRGDTAAKLFAGVEDPTSAARMPVLPALKDALGGAQSFSGFDVVSMGHLFPTSIELYRTLRDSGVKNFALVAKPYGIHSAFPGLWDQLHMKDLGMAAVPNEEMSEVWAPVPFLGKTRWKANPIEDDDEQFNVVAAMCLQRYFLSQGLLIKESDLPSAGPPKPLPFKKLLILDEGAHLLRALHRYFPEIEPHCVVVEQTEFGAREAAKIEKELRCPVISVARSVAKKELEAPAIGENIVFHTVRFIRDLHPELPKRIPNEAVVLGYGPIGQATAAAIRRQGGQVWVYDIDPGRNAQAAADGMHTGSRDEVLAHGHLLFSCAGKKTLSLDEYDKLPDGAILANGASGFEELGTHATLMAHIDEQDPAFVMEPTGIATSRFRDLPVELGTLRESFGRHHVLTTAGGKRVMVLRGGGVVNLEQGLPPEYAQFTLGLLYAGLAQARTEEAPGVHILSPELGTLVTDLTNADLKRFSVSLKDPSFLHLRPWGL